jgi:hypothetical protein
MRLFLIALALSAAPLFAQTHDMTPETFPVAPCAPANSCDSFTDSEIVSASYKYYGLQLDMHWVLDHRADILKELGPACQRHATCLATPGSTFWFCDDVLTQEAHTVCPKLFPNDAPCKTYIEVWLLGIDLRAKDIWKAAQKCSAKSPAPQHSKPLDVWVSPEVLPANFKGKLTFFARDPDTHLPVYAKFAFDNQIIYAPANPEGLPATIYPFDYTPKFKRVPNADGHTDVVPPTVTVTAPNYPTTTFQLAAEVPKMTATMNPGELHGGKNVITIEARDATTGKPVEARVMLGGDPIGDTNLPITLNLNRKGEHAEIWITSLFNKYSDMVIAKAR